MTRSRFPARPIALGLLIGMSGAGWSAAQQIDQSAPITAPSMARPAPRVAQDASSGPQAGPQGTTANSLAGAAQADQAAQVPPGADDLDLRNLRNVFGLPEQEQAPVPQASDVPRLPSPDVPFKVAVLRGLDKITARVSTFDAAIDQPVRFGTLTILTKACKERPPTETPESTAYLEMQEIKPDEATVPVFHGWMFASSPSLSALEHPVYDVWVIGCKDPVNPPEPAPTAVPGPPPGELPNGKPARSTPDENAPPED